jgi:hypothetical protein
VRIALVLLLCFSAITASYASDSIVITVDTKPMAVGVFTTGYPNGNFLKELQALTVKYQVPCPIIVNVTFPALLVGGKPFSIPIPSPTPKPTFIFPKP